jgi:hypothetical protein
LLGADDAELERRGFARQARRLRLLIAETTFDEDFRASVMPDPDIFAAVGCPVLCLYGEKSWACDLMTPTHWSVTRYSRGWERRPRKGGPPRR